MPSISLSSMMMRPRRQTAVVLAIAILGACLLSTVAATPAAAQEAATGNWAAKMFKKTSHDFRTVGRGTKCEYHFEFTNLYQEEVHVASVRSSCGCTTPTISKKTIGTHEKSAVVATFNTSTFIGQKAATVTVVFDRPYYAEVQLKVSGIIRTDITFDPPEVAFGEISAGSGTRQDIVITHTGKTGWKITDVRSHCNDLEVQLSSPKVTPGMVRYRMRINILGSMPEGDVRERLTLISNDASFPTTEMSVNGRVRPTLSASPAAISFGSVKPGATVEKRVVIRGDEPFSITQVVCSDGRFEFDKPSGGKKIHFLKLRFNSDGVAARVAQEVKVDTDLKGGKSVRFVVTGSVAP